ncbi:malectin [Halobacteria archaeon AArc-dxtr1]|nr:malectin [Halobacteria archaeon AArc-dxtr1]
MGIAGCLGDDDGGDDTADDGNGDDDTTGSASFEVSDVDPAEITAGEGEAIDVSATVSNTGDAEGTQLIQLIANNEILDEDDLTLSDGDEETVAFEQVDTAGLAVGSYTLTVASEDGEAEGELSIVSDYFSVSDLEPGDVTIDHGDSFNVEATVTNTGDVEGTQSIQVVVGGDTVDEQEITLAEDEDETVVVEDIDTSEFGVGNNDYAVASDDDTASAVMTLDGGLEAPYALDTGGIAHDETIEIEGLVFDESPEDNEFVEPVYGGNYTEDSGPVAAEIAGTEYDALYQAESHGNDLGYEIGIQNGTYDITLHFAEIFTTAIEEGEGFRIFDIYIQDELVYEGFDILAIADGNEAVVETFRNVEVTDNVLRIETEWDPDTEDQNTKFSGLEVHPAQNEVSAPYAVNLGGSVEEEEPQSNQPVTIDGLRFDEVQDPDDAESIPHLEIFGDHHPDEADFFTPPANRGAETDEEIDGTDHPALYQTYFFGNNFGFEFAIEDGTYDLVLHNSENFADEEGGRVFDILVQGEIVAEEYDIYAEVGDFAAHEFVVEDVEVDDGSLTIETETVEDMSKFAGIEIRDPNGDDNGDDEDDSEPDPVSVPYGLDAGGTENDETVEIDGLEFDDSPDANDAVSVFGDSGGTSGMDPDDDETVFEGTEDDVLYASEMSGEDWGLEIGIDDGTYDVTLHFSDWPHFDDRERIQNVLLQGEEVLSEYHVEDGVAHPETFEGVEVTDGTLAVEFEVHPDSDSNTKVNGIEIHDAE